MSQQSADQSTLPTFAQLGVAAPLVRALDARGITTPFPIQAASLPDSLAGADVLGRGRTGSGKTVAFALPLLTTLVETANSRRRGKPRALVLVPTRELAAQVHETVDFLAREVGLTTMTIFGGVGQNPQVAQLRKGVDVVIATPGRLEDLMGQGHCDLGDVEVTVLDEADHMADLGFLPVVKRILDATPRDTQRLLFSATLDNGIDVLVKRYLTDPVTHSVDDATSQVPAMDHHVFLVQSTDKGDVVRELVSGRGRTLAFTRTKHAAKKLARQLTAAGVPATDLHGNLSQAARQRNLAAFGEGTTRVLVATDIAARGIHVDGVNLVVHVDPPTEHKAYLHRSGRTARAGSDGTVVTVTTRDQTHDVRGMMRKAAIKPTLATVAPGDAVITALTGPPAEYVAPEEVVAVPARGSGGGRSGGSRSGGSRSGGRSGGSRSGGRQGGRTESGRGESRTEGGRGQGGRPQGGGRSGSSSSGGSRSGGSGRRGGQGSGSAQGQRSGGSRAGGRSGGSRSGGAAAFSSSSTAGRRSR